MNTTKIGHLLQLAFLTISLMAQPACEKSTNLPTGVLPGPNTGVAVDGWLIPKASVFDGGPGKDGIPSIDEPKFSGIEAINFLNPEDLILGVKVGQEIRGYPHPILDWHEIVNDQLGNLHLAITYCPLTGTGIGWNREIQGTVTTFGVSGLLYNSNLLPYDRYSDSNWSQMLLSSVNGVRIGTPITTYPLIETTWETWKSMFPDSKILNTTTGFNRSYGQYPYGNYKTNHAQLIFPVTYDDSRLPRKQRGLGILINGQAKFYNLERFEEEVTLVEENFQGVDLVIAGSKKHNFLVAYKRTTAVNSVLEFTAEPFEGDQVIMKDQEGNQWNLFGEAVEGPRKGTSLNTVTGYMAYWFSWAAFYSETQIH